MPLRNIARIVVAFGEALGKAFSRAVQEEMSASRQAAQRQAHQATSSSSSASTRFGAEQEAMRANAKMGISLQESMQILDVRQPLAVEEVEKRYKHLFEINDKSKGGTLYLQSKVYRAKQRLDEELARIARSEEQKKAKQRQYEQESGSRPGG